MKLRKKMAFSFNEKLTNFSIFWGETISPNFLYGKKFGKKKGGKKRNLLPPFNEKR